MHKNAPNRHKYKPLKYEKLGEKWDLLEFSKHTFHIIRTQSSVCVYLCLYTYKYG